MGALGRQAHQLKSEARTPKLERRPKSEIRIPNQEQESREKAQNEMLAQAIGTVV
jgi:hypothetical protein